MGKNFDLKKSPKIWQALEPAPNRSLYEPAAQGKRKAGQNRPGSLRFLYSRPPLRDSTQVMRDSKSKAKPSEGTPQGPVDRGFAANYFGASPVASALNLLRERDFPENRNQTITHSPPARSKPDISTLQAIGHFYFALTLAMTQSVYA